jgi:hypothetical protein
LDFAGLTCADAPVSVLVLAEAPGELFVVALMPVCAALFAVFSVLFTAPFAVFSAPFTAPVAVLAAPLTALPLSALPFAETLAPAAPAFALPLALTSVFLAALLAAFVASEAAPFAAFSAVPVAEVAVFSAAPVAADAVPVTGCAEGIVAPAVPFAIPLAPIPPALTPPASPPPNPAANAGIENTSALPRRSAAAPLRNVMFIVSSFRWVIKEGRPREHTRAHLRSQNGNELARTSLPRENEVPREKN